MKLSVFELAMKEAIKHAPNSGVAAQLQAILDAQSGGGVHTNDADTGENGPPPKKPPEEGGNP